VEAAFGADVHGHPEQIFKVLFEAHHVQQAALRLPLDEEVQVVAIASLAARLAWRNSSRDTIHYLDSPSGARLATSRQPSQRHRARAQI
jgi:hypothetical protein